MRYLQPTFTLPTAPARISQEEYEIRVGLRCPKCRRLMTAKHLAKPAGCVGYESYVKESLK